MDTLNVSKCCYLCGLCDRESDDFLLTSDTHLNISFLHSCKTLKVPQKMQHAVLSGDREGKKCPSL